MGFENRLKQKEDTLDEVQREASFNREFYYYNQKSYLLYECKACFFKKDASGNLTTWKSSGIDNYSVNTDLRSVPDGTNKFPILNNNGKMNLSFAGNYFKQNKIVHPNDRNVVDIYIVYELDPISFSRNTDFTIQNALFAL